MRRLKNTKILAAILSTALILSNTGVYTLADVDEEQTEEEGAVDSVEEGTDGGSVDESEGSPEPDRNSSEDSVDTGSDDSGDDTASESSGDSSSGDSSSGDSGSSGDQIGESPDETADEYDSPAAEGVEEITDDTNQNSGSGSEGSQGEESFGEIVYEEEAVFDEEISEELLTTQTEKKKKSDDSTEEIPVSEETVSYSVNFTDSVSFDEDDNATFKFTVRAGSNPIRVDSVNLSMYPGDSDISYDPVSKEIKSHDEEGYSFESSTEDTVNTEEEKTYVVTIPAASKDRNGSGKTLSKALSEGDAAFSADIETIIFDTEDYSELGREAKSYFIGEYTDTVDEDTEDTEEEQEVFHADYRIRTVRYDGEAHEMVFPRKVMSGRKVLYSADLLEWTETPLSYTEEGDYECYYKMIDEETGDVCRSGSLRMKIRNTEEKSVRSEEDNKTEENERTELAGMFKEIGDTEVTTEHTSKLETFLDAEGVSNLSGAASRAYQSEISREHTSERTSFPAVWSWMMVFFMIISFAVFSVTHDIWAGLYKAFVWTCAYAIVLFNRFRKAMISA